MLSAAREGRIFGTLQVRSNYGLPADGVVYLGGVYGLDANGRLIRPTDAMTDNKHLVVALESGDNTGGVDDHVRVSVCVVGIATLPNGGLVAADLQKPIYAVDDDTLTIDGATGRRVGILIGFDGTNAIIAVGH